MSQIALPVGNTEGATAKVETALHERVFRETRRQTLLGHAAIAMGRALLIGVILALWAYAAARWLDKDVLSDPVSVFNALYHLVESGRIWPDLWQTVYEVLAGYFIGAIAAVA